MSAPSFKKCPKCQTVATIDAPICGACGHQFRTQFTPQAPPDPTQAFNPIQPQFQQPYYGQPVPTRHNPGVAILLHILLTGAGQMYNGQVAKGFLVLFLMILVFIGYWPGTIVLWVVAFIDAIMVANKKRQGFYVDAWQFF